MRPPGPPHELSLETTPGPIKPIFLKKHLLFPPACVTKHLGLSRLFNAVWVLEAFRGLRGTGKWGFRIMENEIAGTKWPPYVGLMAAALKKAHVRRMSVEEETEWAKAEAERWIEFITGDQEEAEKTEKDAALWRLAERLFDKMPYSNQVIFHGRWADLPVREKDIYYCCIEAVFAERDDADRFLLGGKV